MENKKGVPVYLGDTIQGSALENLVSNIKN